MKYDYINIKDNTKSEVIYKKITYKNTNIRTSELLNKITIRVFFSGSRSESRDVIIVDASLRKYIPPQPK